MVVIFVIRIIIQLRRRGDFEDSIERWTEALAIFKVLVAVARKEFKQRTMKTFILIAIMKVYSKQYYTITICSY